MTRICLTILALAWAALFVAVPAHADALTALSRLCPGHEDLAPHVESAAHRYLLHPVLIVAVMRAESHCQMHTVGGHHEVCAMQIHGRAANGLTRAQLADPATCIETGSRWLSIMLQWCLDDVACGLGAYNSGKRKRGLGKYARKVLWFVAQAR